MQKVCVEWVYILIRRVLPGSANIQFAGTNTRGKFALVCR